MSTYTPEYLTCVNCESPYALVIDQGRDWQEVACDECESIYFNGNDPTAPKEAK